MRPLVLLARESLRGPLAGLPRRLAAAGYDAWVLPHPYHLPEDSRIWREIAARKGPVIGFLPLHPRPIEALMRRHGAWPPGSLARDIRPWKTPKAAADGLGPPPAPTRGPGAVRTFRAPRIQRWYPLMDESRCINCGSCLQFCLFGVYGRSEDGRVRIVHPDRCKPGCPACSRICPRGALMFPLYTEDEAIAGAPGLFPKPKADERRRLSSFRTPAQGKGSKGRTPDELDALLEGLEKLQEGRR